jgi:putative folate metabolism gamma-glutamate ligase
MNIQPLKTHPVTVRESLTDIIDTYIPRLEEKTIIAITSKIVSLSQGRVVVKEDAPDKYQLVQDEADGFLENVASNPYDIYLTITNHILIPSAGIDESNGNGLYILYPKDIQTIAAHIWNHLRKRDNLRNVGVIITDSHTTPLRRGVTGIGLGWCGFTPLHSYIGKPDIYGTLLRVSQINTLDALAAASVFAMGEGNEQTPLVIIKDIPHVEFLSRPPTQEEEESIRIPLKDDLYAPLLESVSWVWKKRN